MGFPRASPCREPVFRPGARKGCGEMGGTGNEARAAPFPWTSVLLAAGLSALVLAVLERGRGRLPHDHPTGRSLHERPVTRVGGLAIWAGFVPAALLAPDPVADGSVWLVAWLAVTAVSLADDWRGVPPADSPRRACDRGASRSPRHAGGCRRRRVVAARRARDRRRRAGLRVVRQPLQLHGWQRRAGRGDGDLRLRRLRRGRDARRRALRGLFRACGGGARVSRRQRAARANVHG